MYNSVPFQYTTKASTNLVPVSGASETAKLAGYIVLNTNAAADVWVKMYWSRQGEVPVVGTTIPDITFGASLAGTAPAIAQAALSIDNPVGRMGQLYMWITALPAASDTTSTGAGDGIITLLLQY